jgi:hypothetical protein
MTKENWERKLFYLLTPALMGDIATPQPQAMPLGFSKTEFDLRSHRDKLAPDESQIEKKDHAMNKDFSSRRCLLY